MKRDHFSFEIEILRSIVSFWCVNLMFAHVHKDNGNENNIKNKKRKKNSKKKNYIKNKRMVC